METVKRAGEIEREINAGPGLTIRKVVDRVAYPRNGNFHNATVSYRWEVRKLGRLIGQARTLREAREIAAESTV